MGFVSAAQVAKAAAQQAHAEEAGRTLEAQGWRLVWDFSVPELAWHLVAYPRDAYRAFVEALPAPSAAPSAAGEVFRRLDARYAAVEAWLLQHGVVVYADDLDRGVALVLGEAGRRAASAPPAGGAGGAGGRVPMPERSATPTTYQVVLFGSAYLLDLLAAGDGDGDGPPAVREDLRRREPARAVWYGATLHVPIAPRLTAAADDAQWAELLESRTLTFACPMDWSRQRETQGHVVYRCTTPLETILRWAKEDEGVA